jgi:ribonuclease E
VIEPTAEPAPAFAAPATAAVAPTVAPTVAPVTASAPAPAPIQAPAQKPSTASGDLQQVLQAAGLTLATTDPEKLRAAQQAAAQTAPAPRVQRERKPPVVVPSEPLVQIETRQP